MEPGSGGSIACSRCYYDQMNPTVDPVYQNSVKPLMWICAAILPSVINRFNFFFFDMDFDIRHMVIIILLNNSTNEIHRHMSSVSYLAYVHMLIWFGNNKNIKKLNNMAPIIKS